MNLQELVAQIVRFAQEGDGDKEVQVITRQGARGMSHFGLGLVGAYIYTDDAFGEVGAR